MEESLRAAFRGCADPDADEIRVACLVARLLDRSADAAALAARLDELAAACTPSRPSWQALAALGFTGNDADYEALDNSNLAWVLEHRRGIPITLGIVLMHVARANGARAVGLNFPGHFLVQVDEAVIDPFAMKRLDAELDAYVERLPAAARSGAMERLFTPATPVMVALRMLNNVKLAYSRSGARDRMLEVIDAQLALAPDQPSLLVERGDCWQRLGVVEPAREAFREALRLLERGRYEEAELIGQTARARLEELGKGGDVIH